MLIATDGQLSSGTNNMITPKAAYNYQTIYGAGETSEYTPPPIPIYYYYTDRDGNRYTDRDGNYYIARR